MKGSLLKFWSAAKQTRKVRSIQDKIPDEDFIVLCYDILFERLPDRKGFRTHRESLARGKPRREFVQNLIDSQEFKNRLSGVNPLESLHRARMIFIQGLPVAERIVDLGGASKDGPQGALYLMGYPHRAKELFIVDLPPEDRLEKPQFSSVEEYNHEGTVIRYIHCPMSDLSAFTDGSVDLVFSGESIEHVPEEEAKRTVREAWRVLRPGGHFCLDTPNGRLTRLQSPDELVHPEHHKEYTYEELESLVLNGGFEIEEFGGICPMRKSVEAGRFQLEEMIENSGLDPEPQVSYLLYVKARKPAPYV